MRRLVKAEAMGAIRACVAAPDSQPWKAHYKPRVVNIWCACAYGRNLWKKLALLFSEPWRNFPWTIGRQARYPPLRLETLALRGLRQLGRRDHTPVLIAVGNLYGSEAIVDTSLLQALEAYQLWMGISGKRGRERKFTALASKIYREHPDLGSCRVELSKLLREQVPTPDDAIKAVENATYPGRIMSLIIRHYEEGMRGDIMIDDFQQEHMMPETPTEYWHEVTGTRDLAEYRRIVNRIGNITPLDPGTNNTVKNRDWPTKCAWYKQNVPNWLVSEIARQNEDGWTPDKILARSRAIAGWAVSRRWNLPEKLSQLAGTDFKQ
jgi:hypothetical protein